MITNAEKWHYIALNSASTDDGFNCPSCQNNHNEYYTERKAIHEPFGYLLDLVSSFDSKQNKTQIL